MGEFWASVTLERRPPLVLSVPGGWGAGIPRHRHPGRRRRAGIYWPTQVRAHAPLTTKIIVDANGYGMAFGLRYDAAYVLRLGVGASSGRIGTAGLREPRMAEDLDELADAPVFRVR